MFDRRIIPVLIILIVLFAHWMEIEKGAFRQKKKDIAKSGNPLLDFLTRKLGSPHHERGTYIWLNPLNYPFFQVRLDSHNMIYVSVKIDKAIDMNLENINVSLDSNNGILWSFNPVWNEVIINLYYCLFNLNNKKALIRTKHILASNQAHEMKLINDISKLLEENSNIEIKLTQPEFRSDLAMTEEDLDINMHTIPEMPDMINSRSSPKKHDAREPQFSQQNGKEQTFSQQDDDIMAFNSETKGNQLDKNWDFLPGNDTGMGNFFSVN
jgi:hypothetical protein